MGCKKGSAKLAARWAVGVLDALDGRWPQAAPARRPSVAGRRGLRVGFMAAPTMPKRPAHLAAVCRSLWAWCNGTEQTILLPIRAGGEKNRVGAKISATRGVASDTKAPQPVDDDCLPVGIARFVDKLPGRRIVGVDMTVAEISDQ